MILSVISDVGISILSRRGFLADVLHFSCNEFVRANGKNDLSNSSNWHFMALNVYVGISIPFFYQPMHIKRTRINYYLSTSTTRVAILSDVRFSHLSFVTFHNLNNSQKSAKHHEILC